MTRVIFIRHGEAEGNVNRNFHGYYNSNLTDNGREQVKLAAKWLENEHIDVFYSSDLTRTYDTALAVAQGRGLDIIKNERLREICGGDWEEVRWEELPEKFPESYEHWLKSPHLLVMPNGEAMTDFQDRVYSEVNDIVTANAGKSIAIATHGTVIKVLMCRYYGKHLSELPGMRWHDNAAVTIVEFDDNMKPTVLIEGENSFLGELSTLAKQSWWRKKLIEGEEE